MRTWFSVQNVANANGAEISIFDEIGMWGVTAKDFIGQLNTITAKTITLSINSPGGSVFDALTIFNALRMSGKEITVRILGIAASAASYVAMVGSRIEMPENTFMFVHNPIGAVYGNAEDMRSTASDLDKIGASITATYVTRSGKPEKDIVALLEAETLLTAAECLQHGLADEVLPAMNVKAKFEIDTLPKTARAVFEASMVASHKDPPVVPIDPSDDPRPVDPEIEAKRIPAEEIKVLADVAGLGEYASVWALNDDLTTIEAVAAVIADAKEIRALCDLARRPLMAAKFIKTGKPIKDVRAALVNALAAEDEKNMIDTSRPVNQAENKSPVAVDPEAIYAARRQPVQAQRSA